MDKELLKKFAEWLHESNCFSDQAIDLMSFDLQDAYDLVESFIRDCEQNQWKPSGLLALVLSTGSKSNLTSQEYKTIWQYWVEFSSQQKIVSSVKDAGTRDQRATFLINKQIQDFGALKGVRYSTRCELVYNFAKVVAEELKDSSYD